MNPKADFYFIKAGKWKEALALLRSLVLDCGLTEELKWGVPCYTFQKSNIALIHVFKEYCAVLFVKGALLQDKAGLLIQQTKNTQSARQARFTHVRDIITRAPTLKSYIYEAIEVEKAGLKVAFNKNPEPVPLEFRETLQTMPAVKTAFEALTPGRQRAYLLYFSQPRQSKTRVARIEKCIQQILKGKGLRD